MRFIQQLEKIYSEQMNPSDTEKDLERCTMRGTREILFQLRTLIRHGNRLSVIFDEGRQSFLTVLMDISPDESLLYFDVGGSEEINRTFLNGQRCLFVGVVDGIRLQFSGENQSQINEGGETFFAVRIPKSFLRVQRREAFRLQLPALKPYICRLQRGSLEELTLPIYDISTLGIGIQVFQKPKFEVMARLENCWLDLRESGTFQVLLEVRYISELENPSRKTLWHIGCKFIDLPPAAETMIQRFMGKIEIERRAMAKN